MQGSKGNEKGEKEYGMNIHSVASASTLVLGDPRETPQLKHIKVQLFAYCPPVNPSHLVAAGWRTQTVMMMSSWPNVGL